MTKLMEYLLEPQTAVVFDIDGVLAVYEFGELLHSACPDEDWEDYVRTHDPYASSRPVPQIKRLSRLRARAACGPARRQATSRRLASVPSSRAATALPPATW